MIIRCPQCEHSRSIPESKIPATAELATCPKCKHRFRFRTLSSAQARFEESTPAKGPEQKRSRPSFAAVDQPLAERPQSVIREQVEREGEGVWDAVNDLNQRWQEQIDTPVADVSVMPLAVQPAPASLSGRNGVAAEPSHALQACAPATALVQPAPKEGIRSAAVPQVAIPPHDGTQTPLPAETTARNSENRLQVSKATETGGTPKAASTSTPKQGNVSVTTQNMPSSGQQMPACEQHPLRPAQPTLMASGQHPLPASTAPLAPSHQETTNGAPLPGPETAHVGADAVGEQPKRRAIFSYNASGRKPEERVEQDLRMLKDDSAARPTRDLGVLREYPDTPPTPQTLPGTAQGASPLGSAPMSDLEENGIPWENPARNGWIRGFIDTMHGVMFRGADFFAGMSAGGSLTPGYLFFLIMGYITIISSIVWIHVASTLLPDLAAASSRNVALPFLLLLAPLALGLMLLFVTGFIRIVLRIFAPEQAEFSLIYKVASYSVAPFILSAVPFIGPPLGAVWYIVSLITGCRNTLKLSWHLSVGAPLIPALLLLCGIVAYFL